MSTDHVKIWAKISREKITPEATLLLNTNTHNAGTNRSFERGNWRSKERPYEESEKKSRRLCACGRVDGGETAQTAPLG